MFERRIRVILILPILCGLLILGRLFSLQVIKAGYYAEKIEAAMVAPRQFLPALRGSILDRNGLPLVTDEPAHDVTVHYGALSMDDKYLASVAERIRRIKPEFRNLSSAELKAEATRQVATMWLKLEKITGIPLTKLRQRRDRVCSAVESLRQYIHQNRQDKGLKQSLEKIRLREEDLFHPILRDVSAEMRTRIELELAEMPFVRIEPSVRRIWNSDSDCVCHLLGGMGQVSPELVRDDPHRDDPLSAYRVDDEAGISGVERLAETMLRGKRGFEERSLGKRGPDETSMEGRLIQHVAPQDGLDVQLTIDREMQRTITGILTQAVAEHPPSTGASCVVLDVETREIIALVSVPTYDAKTLRDNYTSLRDDTKNAPLRFRAVAEEYQPGSILKPVSLLAGLSSGTVDASSSVFCDGSLFSDSDKWHCWTFWRNLPGHGHVSAEEAIQHSCNIYFYTLGQKMGADRLTEFYRLFLMGSHADDRRVGTGLIEERAGIIPTEEWMKTQRHRALQPADGRNFAIGQGELQITPLCAANMYATLASGVYREPTLIANDARPRPVMQIAGVSPQNWETARRGVYRCVNEEGGTANRFAKLDTIELCGKTGSAECVSRVTQWHYTFDGDGGRQTSIVAPTIEAAREYLNLPETARYASRQIAERYPPPDPIKGKVPTHAWFAGFAPYRSPKIAFAIVIEYGGGGGNTAGPTAKSIVEALMAASYLSSPGVAQLDNLAQ
jgi:penicillin-binding protein 2